MFRAGASVSADQKANTFLGSALVSIKKSVSILATKISASMVMDCAA